MQTFFHGTIRARLNTIFEHGLLTGHEARNRGFKKQHESPHTEYAAALREMKEKDDWHCAFFSRDFAVATRYAIANEAHAEEPSGGVILRIFLPDDWPVERDPWHAPSQYRTKRSIPPEYIDKQTLPVPTSARFAYFFELLARKRGRRDWAARQLFGRPSDPSLGEIAADLIDATWVFGSKRKGG